MRSCIAVAALLLAACAPSSAGGPREGDVSEQWRAVAVRTKPVDLDVERIGRLVYRGGVEISSDDDVFGGLSGMEALDDGRILILNDDAEWFDARLVLDESGRLVGVADVRYAWMLDERGHPFFDPRAGDSEGLAQLSDGRFAVSFEQSQSVRLYDFNRDGPFGLAMRGPRLAETRGLRANVGLEALTATGDGALLIGAEGGGRATTSLWRARLDAPAPVEPLISYPLKPGYSLTGLDRIPGGGYVALERFYAPIIGGRARLTYFSDAALNAGGDVLEVEELAELAPPMPIDNFEGVAATRAPDGATRIYVVSDNNYNRRQRTLLLAFDIAS